MDTSMNNVVYFDEKFLIEYLYFNAISRPFITFVNEPSEPLGHFYIRL
jgi:hypothetical protein